MKRSSKLALAGAALALPLATLSTAGSAVGGGTGLGWETDPHKADHPSDPLESASTEQRAEGYVQQRADALARCADWINQFEAADANPMALPSAELLAEPAPAHATLKEAVAAASLIVEATISDLHFSAAGTQARLRIEQVVKGDGRAEQEVTTAYAGGPEPPVGPYAAGVLGGSPGQPFLPEGSRVFVLLEPMPGGKTTDLTVQTFSGLYEVRDGRVVAGKNNPFGPVLDGLTTDAFVTAISRAAS